ncbi:MAG: glycosyltransferase [Thalassolituus sp.]|uniref:glycosyltransferase n=1 Tax=Thalassolituus sp. TaxID=2030822 RepID=UPI003981B079
MKISVLMSVFSEPKEWLVESIESILNQTYKNIELVVVLDNPANEMAKELILDYARMDSRLVLSVNEKNLGLSKSLNYAFSVSSGDIIARMDADDVSVDSRIAEQLDFIVKNKCDFIASNIEFFGGGQGCLFSKKEADNLNEVIRYRDIMPHPTWMMKRSVFQCLGGYRDIGPAQDYEFICRAVKSKVKIAVLNKVHLYYRLSSTNISTQKRIYQLYNYILIERAMRKGVDYYSSENYFYKIIFVVVNGFGGFLDSAPCLRSSKFIIGLYRKYNLLSILVFLRQRNILRIF